MIEHTAARPSWDCRACAKPWPCDPAREALVAELDPVQLSLYLWANFEEASGHLNQDPIEEMIERFLTWAPPARIPPTALFCLGASTGFEGDCGHPGPHAEHPINKRPLNP